MRGEPAASVSPVTLFDLDGQARDPFQGVESNKATVFIFVNSTCPISNRYAPEVRRLHAKFAPEGIAFWLVYADPEESSEVIRKHLSEFQYPIAALRDPKHQLVKATLVRVTPEAAVFNRESKLVYHGRIDDRVADYGKERPAPTERDLEQALEAVIAGKPVPKASAPAVGCYISQIP